MSKKRFDWKYIPRKNYWNLAKCPHTGRSDWQRCSMNAAPGRYYCVPSFADTDRWPKKENRKPKTFEEVSLKKYSFVFICTLTKIRKKVCENLQSGKFYHTPTQSVATEKLNHYKLVLTRCFGRVLFGLCLSCTNAKFNQNKLRYFGILIVYLLTS